MCLGHIYVLLNSVEKTLCISNILLIKYWALSCNLFKGIFWAIVIIIILRLDDGASRGYKEYRLNSWYILSSILMRICLLKTSLTRSLRWRNFSRKAAKECMVKLVWLLISAVVIWWDRLWENWNYQVIGQNMHGEICGNCLY